MVSDVFEGDGDFTGALDKVNFQWIVVIKRFGFF